MSLVSKIFLIVSLLFVVSCNSDRVIYSETVTPDKEGWNKDKPAKFSVMITDTIRAYTVKLKVTNTNDYRWANLFVFSKIEIPEDKSIVDTINLLISNSKGEWTGEGVGDNYSNVFPVKRNIKFPKIGVYTFSFEQAMRCPETNYTVEGVSEIGLEIVEFNQK